MIRIAIYLIQFLPAFNNHVVTRVGRRHPSSSRHSASFFLELTPAQGQQMNSVTEIFLIAR
jgi:hypothetical protein